MYMRSSVVTAFLILSVGILHSQSSGSVRRYTLKECIQIAMQQNFDIKEVYARSKAASAGLTQAFGQYLPSASLNANYSRQLTNLTNQISFVNGVPVQGAPLANSYSLSGLLNWNIFDGFERENRYDMAKGNVDALENDIRASRLQVAYNITTQYLNVLRTEQLLKARQENLTLSKLTYDRVKALYDNGKAPITQLLSQETEVANQETAVIGAENDHDRAKVTLLTTMCLNPNQSSEFASESFPGDATRNDIGEFRQQIGTEEASVGRAFDQRPDIKAAIVRETASEAGVGAARAGYFPDLRANGGYSWSYFDVSRFDTQGRWYVGLNFSMPLFDQFNTNLNIENAKLSQTQRQLDLQRLKQQIEQSVRNAYLTLGAAEKGLDVTERAMKSATTSMDAMQERFNVGGATLIDVQTANNQLITARINRVTAVYAYLDARALVEFATGLFGEP